MMHEGQVIKVPFKLTHPDAKVPTKGTEGAVGYDIYSVQNVVILPGQQLAIPTGFSCSIPAGMYVCIAPRSGLALRGIQVLGGVIDQDYTEEVKVMLLNSGQTTVAINKQQRIAQAIFTYCNNEIQFEEVQELQNTSHGSKGFGSTDQPKHLSKEEKFYKDLMEFKIPGRKCLHGVPIYCAEHIEDCYSCDYEVR